MCYPGKTRREERKNVIELHLHLDGSLRPATVLSLAREEGIALPTEDLGKLTEEYLTVDERCADLPSFLARFDLPIKVLASPAAIRRTARELTEDLAGEGHDYAEIRFAPQYARFTGFSQEEYVQAALSGMKEALGLHPSLHAALILCCMRGADLEAENEETIRLTARYLGSGVCAADLAGAENLFPNEGFADVFALARRLDVPFTIHAGEALGAESVRSALQMGASRIGHGVRAAEDADLVRELAARKIPLEVCYSSNLQTKTFADPQEYPLRKLFDAGVHVTVNTDNRTVSDLTLPRELARVQKDFSFTDDEMRVMEEYAREAAFT